MRRVLRAALAAALLTLVAAAAGCGGGGNSSSGGNSGGSNGSHQPVTITLWHPWTGREKKIFETNLATFHTKYPWITVNAVSFPNSDTFDNQVIQAVKGGNPPDAVLSFGPDYDGQYCSSGIMQDLKPYMDKDGISTSIFSPAALTYSQFDGKLCMLPSLTDAYGLYYNKDMLAAKGIEPPKTLTELADDAKKLTVRNPDGSIKVAGFVPLQDWEQFGITDLATAYGAQFFDDSGNPVISKDPAWASAFQWQKDLIDWYGYDNLVKFNAAYGGDAEFSPHNAFETGKVAMTWDGEWRTSFIADEAPHLNYGTVPFPTADDKTDLLGAQRVGGTVVGIPDGSKHPQEAWDLVKFLSTDDDYIVPMANGVGNVPTTKTSATSPDLKLPPQFQTFIDVWNNPKSRFWPPITATGSGYYKPLTDFEEKWQAGNVTDLQTGLEQVDEQIKNQLALSGAP